MQPDSGQSRKPQCMVSVAGVFLLVEHLDGSPMMAALEERSEIDHMRGYMRRQTLSLEIVALLQARFGILSEISWRVECDDAIRAQLDAIANGGEAADAIA